MLKYSILFACFISITLQANAFSDKIDDSTEVEKNIEKTDKEINKKIIMDSTLVAYVLSKKSNQIFALSKQKELLNISVIGEK